MKILITGGSGFIGSNLVRFLVQRGHTVVNVDKLSYAANPRSLSDLIDLPSYAFEQIDLADLEKVGLLHRIFEQHKPAAVLHLAAESHVDRSIEDPDAFVQSNILGTAHLLQASLAYWRRLPETDDAELSDAASDSASAGAKMDGVSGANNGKREIPSPVRRESQIPCPTRQSFRFLHVSTDEVYGSLDLEAPRFTEDSRYAPRSPYSASKAASDHLVRAWQTTYGLPVVLSLSSNNYGPYQHAEKLIPLVIRKCFHNEAIPVYGRGDNIRDWLHVADHCAALHAVLCKGSPGTSYHIGGQNELRNIDLVRMICDIMDELRPEAQPQGHHRLITFVADRPGHDFRYAMESTRIREELGWTPKVDFQAGLRQTVQWYLEHRDWWDDKDPRSN
jgi:dTDP-glucose 4,6-dehydratase